MNKQRKCICCGTGYDYCGNCPSDRNKESWYALYCSDNCHDIFATVNEHNFGLVTKEEARELLKTCDLSNVESFNEIVKDDIMKVMEGPKKTVKFEAPKHEVVKE